MIFQSILGIALDFHDLVEALTILSVFGGFLYFLVSQTLRLNNLYRDLKKQDSVLREQMNKLQDKFETLIEKNYKNHNDIKTVARTVNNLQKYLHEQDNTFCVRANDLIELD